jgi:hypothetical protein
VACLEKGSDCEHRDSGPVCFARQACAGDRGQDPYRVWHRRVNGGCRGCLPKMPEIDFLKEPKRLATYEPPFQTVASVPGSRCPAPESWAGSCAVTRFRVRVLYFLCRQR